jgi:hypothetical protein
MTALIVMVWIVGFSLWAVSRFGEPKESGTTGTEGQRDAASRRRHPSGVDGIDGALADCNPVWSALDDQQLERLLRDAAS